MGALLDKPITDKDTGTGEKGGLRYGYSSMQGWRIEMEDAHIAGTEIEHASSQPSYLFGVFDGHGGKIAARISARDMTKVIDTKLRALGAEKMEEALQTAFVEVDTEMRKQPALTEAGETLGGTTAVVGLVMSDKVYVANAGDSRAIFVGKDGRVTPLSFDHKPTNDEEERRIVRSGGHVSMGRVNGDLAVSRALGDFEFKDKDLSPEEQAVCPVPDVRCIERSPEDEFLLIACDGIWDVMSNEEAGAFLRDRAQNGLGHDVGLLCEALLDACLEKGSKDNMTAVVVAFEAAPSKGPVATPQTKEEEEESAKGQGDSVDGILGSGEDQ